MKVCLLPALALLVAGGVASVACATAPKTYDYDYDAALGEGGIDPDGGSPDGKTPPAPKDRVACGTSFCRVDQTCEAGRCVFACTGTQVPGDYATLAEAIAPLADRDAVICYKATGGTTPTGSVNVTTSKSVTIIGVSPDQTPVSQITVGSGTTGTGTVTLQGMVATTVSLAGTTKVEIKGGKIGYVYVNATQAGEVKIDGADLGGTASSYGLYVTPGAATNPRVTVQNSYFHDAQSAAVQVYSTSTYAADVQILNNTFARNRGGILLTSSTSNIKLTVIGNIFLNTQGIALSMPAFAATSEFSNNLLFGNTTNYGGLAADGANYLKVDPMLDSTIPPDTRTGSPARGAGLAGKTPTADFYGIARGAKPDLGAVQSP